ncbi:hypothetical protein V8C86DRAFT_2687950 [Haematococcus lacustris]
MLSTLPVSDLLRPASPADIVLVSCGSFNPPTLMHLHMCDTAVAALRMAGHRVLGCYLSPVSDAYLKHDLAPAIHRLAMCQLAVSSSTDVMVDSWEALQPQYTPSLLVLRHVAARMGEQALRTCKHKHEHQQPACFSSSFQQMPCSAIRSNDIDEHWCKGQDHKNGIHGQQGTTAVPAATSASEAAAKAEPAAPAASGAVPQQGHRSQTPHVMLLCGADVLASMAQPGAWHLPEVLLQEHGVVCVERRHGTGALQQAGGLQTLLEQPGSLLNEFKHCILVLPAGDGTGDGAGDGADGDRSVWSLSSTRVRATLRTPGGDITGMVPEPVRQYLLDNPHVYGTQKADPPALFGKDAV